MRNTDIFDDYLNGRMNSDERALFHKELENDVVLSTAFSKHRELVESLKVFHDRNELKNKLQAIHQKEFGNDAKIMNLSKSASAVKQTGKTVMVAASAAVIAVLGTIAILSTGGYLLKKQSNQIMELALTLKATNDGIIGGANAAAKQKAIYASANTEGSAFALNNQGYIVTSYHIVSGSDSVFIQNKTTDRIHARVVMVDPKIDLAVLKIDSAAIIGKWQVPYGFASKTSELGEKIFTLGFPHRDVVYGEGSVSSMSGYRNDTTMYQVSIPVNPGNSGGPLLDEQGNIIGVIRGKNNGAEATGYAIKSDEVVRAITKLGADSIVVGNKKNSIKGLKRTEQIKKIDPYVFNVLVYKKD